MAPPQAPVTSDPHGLGASLGRLGSSGRRNSKTAATAAAVLLRQGEVVECVVHGQFAGANAVAVLTNLRLLLVNEREWKPTVVEFTIDQTMNVQGWQDDRSAALTIQSSAGSAQIERIGDRPLAVEMAQRIRARAATG